MKEKIIMMSLFVLVLLGAAGEEVLTARGDEISAFGKALTYQTVSYSDSEKFDKQVFYDFHAYLEQTFPLVHRYLKKEVVNLSLLFTWQGKSSKAPVLFAAHMDVVPIEKGTEDEWSFDPYSGEVSNGKIWGRGAFDDKIRVVSILNSVERLLAEGYVPENDIYLALGHDEEVGGGQGAKVMGELLHSRGVRLKAVIDEGGAVMHNGVMMGIQDPIGIIGVSEKGEVNLRLNVAFEGISHSSMPPLKSPVGILSQAIVKLEQNQFPIRLTPPVTRFFNDLGPYVGGLDGFLLSNTWLSGFFIGMFLETDPIANALIRTTTSANVVQGSEKFNVIPDYAEAVVNFRILPGDTVAGVKQRVIDVINDNRVEVSIDWATNPRDPRKVTATDTEIYRQFEVILKEIYPEVKTFTPWLITGGTDSRHYQKVTDNIFGFSAVKMDPEKKIGPHGIDEYVSIEDYNKSLNMFYRLMKQF